MFKLSSIKVGMKYQNIRNEIIKSNNLVMSCLPAAVVIEEKDLTGEKLVSTVSELLAEPGKLAAMGQNARELSVDDSLDRIADALLKLVKTP